MTIVAEQPAKTAQNPAQNFGTAGIKPLERPSLVTRLFMGVVALVERLNVKYSKVGHPPIYDKAVFPWTKEIERGVCLVGPHRDDLVLTLGDLPAKGYASHGESWSYALALRLASATLLRGGPGGPGWGPDGDPVLILDDVFAELDTRRRDRLAELVAPSGQVLVAAGELG